MKKKRWIILICIIAFVGILFGVQHFFLKEYGCEEVCRTRSHRGCPYLDYETKCSFKVFLNNKRVSEKIFLWFGIDTRSLKEKQKIERDTQGEILRTAPYRYMIQVYCKSGTTIDDIWNIAKELKLHPVDVVEGKPSDSYMSKQNIPNDAIVYDICFKAFPYCGNGSDCSLEIGEYDFIYTVSLAEQIGYVGLN